MGLLLLSGNIHPSIYSSSIPAYLLQGFRRVEPIPADIRWEMIWLSHYSILTYLPVCFKAHYFGVNVSKPLRNSMYLCHPPDIDLYLILFFSIFKAGVMNCTCRSWAGSWRGCRAAAHNSSRVWLPVLPAGPVSGFWSRSRGTQHPGSLDRPPG